MNNPDFLQFWLSEKQTVSLSFSSKDGRPIRPTQLQIDRLVEYLELMKKNLSETEEPENIPVAQTPEPPFPENGRWKKQTAHD